MAFPIFAALAGAGALVSYAGAQQQAESERMAGELTARNLEINAKAALAQAAEQEKELRRQFRRHHGSNVAAIGASGIRQEGSAAEVLRDNAARAAEDALRIRRTGRAEHNNFLRQAHSARMTGESRARGAEIGGIASLLGGAGSAGSMLGGN